MSDTPEKETNDLNTESAETAEAVQPIDLLATLSQKADEAEKKLLYLRAEFDNFRRQSIKERSELLKFGGERLAKDLLETLDIFETALATNISNANVDEFVKGIKLTQQQLKSTLEKHSIVAVEAQGAAFDPQIHEALGMEPSDEIPEGHVSKVFKKPYKYHDKILRPGQVILAKPK